MSIIQPLVLFYDFRLLVFGRNHEFVTCQEALTVSFSSDRTEASLRVLEVEQRRRELTHFLGISFIRSGSGEPEGMWRIKARVLSPFRGDSRVARCSDPCERHASLNNTLITGDPHWLSPLFSLCVCVCVSVEHRHSDEPNHYNCLWPFPTSRPQCCQ